MRDNSVRILRIVYENILMFKEHRFEVNFMATDRVSDSTQVFHIDKSIYTQKMVSLAGINASGKTSSLKLIYLAMSVVLDNVSLNDATMYGKKFLNDKTKLTIDFYYKGKFYELQSFIRVRRADELDQFEWYFDDEWLYCKDKAKVRTKKDALTPGDLLRRRSAMPPEARSVLKDDDSIVITVTRDNTTGLHQMLLYTNVNVLTATGSLPITALHVFDANLDLLKVDKVEKGASYQVKFKDWDEPVILHNPLELSRMISSGTIKGQNLLFYIKRILKTGGYMIVDELENHLNKELVRMITNIFKDERINKYGACLIFSTHYVELLDFVDRKDNIFITRKNPQAPNQIEILNYADEVHRNDVKKSEVLLSNYIQGTAPRYADIQALEDSLCEE